MKPAPSALDASSLIQVVGEYLTKTGDVVNDIVEMVPWPAGMVPVDVTIDNGALGASATLDVGVMSGNYLDAVTGRTMAGNEFLAAGAAATAGVLRRNKTMAVAALAIQATDKSIGVKFLGANPAIGQLVRMVATFAPNPSGVAVA
jgi:hypothetical protein